MTPGTIRRAALPLDRILALGAETFAGGDPAVFNMAVMGMRLAQRVNGVSKLHGAVSRSMFSGLWPGFDIAEVPIALGDQRRARADLGRAGDGHACAGAAVSLPAGRASGLIADPTETVVLGSGGQPTRRGSGSSGGCCGRGLVAEARRRLRASWRQRGASDAELIWIDGVLDEDVLTIGFARRVPSYKRLTMMLHDPARLTALLLDPDRPVQIVVAGKAHPADDGGKQLIQQLVRFADDPRGPAPDRLPA